ncbi:spondin domain-containing protein [Shewanella aquimarina]|uniref:spondin domain-containing protein n=1 Tax=Shewanella aquimarina TaxID=260365 RepID=UPI002014F290|nr:spondin domain-containing protein [Shewanella aquimarina]MCL2909858.1 spondin domain-containing protein [Shewanella aquimarina]
MKLQEFKSSLPLSIVALSVGLLLSACSDNDHDNNMPEPPAPPVERSFTLTVTNLTANQPMSPLALLATSNGYHAWQSGEPASLALEQLAEGGDQSGYSAEMDGIDMVVSGAGILPPGASESLTLTQVETAVSSLSLLTMLVNTNDAFSGLDAIDLSQMAVAQTQSFYTPAYDAGTEANSEIKGSIPGPADGGEGFNAGRDDVDRVHLHPGVISQDDDLNDSVLHASHRFDNPVLRVTIQRTR